MQSFRNWLVAQGPNGAFGGLLTTIASDASFDPATLELGQEWLSKHKDDGALSEMFKAAFAAYASERPVDRSATPNIEGPTIVPPPAVTNTVDSKHAKGKDTHAR